MVGKYNLCNDQLVDLSTGRAKTYILVEFSDKNHKMIVVNDANAKKGKMNIKNILALEKIIPKSQILFFQISDSEIHYLARINEPLPEDLKVIQNQKIISTRSTLKNIQAEKTQKRLDVELFEEYGIHISLDDYCSLISTECLTGHVIEFICATKYSALENSKFRVVSVYDLYAFLRYFVAIKELAHKDIIANISKELDMIIKKFNIAEKSVLMPLCFGRHWTLNCISLKEITTENVMIFEFRHFNSAGCTFINKDIVEAVQELLKRQFNNVTTLCQIYLIRPKCPRQPNAYDCGVYMLHNIESIMSNGNDPILSYTSDDAFEDRQKFMKLVAARVPQNKMHLIGNDGCQQSDLVRQDGSEKMKSKGSGKKLADFIVRIDQQECEEKQRKEYLKNYQVLDCHEMSNEKIIKVIKGLTGMIKTIIKENSLQNCAKVIPFEITTSNVLSDRQMLFTLDIIGSLINGIADDMLYNMILPFTIVQLYMEYHNLSEDEALQRIKLQNNKKALFDVET